MPWVPIDPSLATPFHNPQAPPQWATLLTLAPAVPEDRVGENGAAFLATRAAVCSAGRGHRPRTGSVDSAGEPAPERPQQVPTALLSVVPSDKLREAALACPTSHSKARVPYVGGAPSLPGSFKPQHPTITPQVLPAPDWPGRTQGSPQKVMVLSREKALYLPTWAVCPSFFP